MPNKQTFSIKPIGDLITGHILKMRVRKMLKGCMVLDPFASKSKLAELCDFTNDIDPAAPTTHHLDAIEFLKTFKDNSADVVLFDPPYSPRQVSECYKKLGQTVNMQTTQASFWGNLKKEMGRIVKPGGIVITCGWNSGGIGKSCGFEIEEILMVAHGGWHNDTIVTVERKLAKNCCDECGNVRGCVDEGYLCFQKDEKPFWRPKT
jgi:hypothetical protein